MGPLSGIRVLEFEAIGPGPFAGMLLADMGADVLVVDRPAAGDLGLKRERWYDVLMRGKRSVTLDLKADSGKEAALQLIGRAEALIEGFRPGVMERLGLGPHESLEKNPRLVYGRMTGWGQSGPLAHVAGHDINYISVTGALCAIGPAEGHPVPPLNLVGDYGGGALYLVVGMLAALLEARTSGEGQVVDAAMCDGVASLMNHFMSLSAIGAWRDARSSNLLDGGAHFYGTYQCADGRYISIGAIEPKFYALLREKTGITDSAFDSQNDQAVWPDLRRRLEAIVKTRTQAQWCELLEGTDACVA